MQTKLRETLRWIFVICYVGFSVLIYTTHLIRKNTPVGLALFLLLGCLLLVGFKATQEKGKQQEIDKAEQERRTL